MRFQIKKLLEGYDPADLIEQSMYCFGSDSSDNDNSGGDEADEVAERSGDVAQDYSSSPNDGGYASPQAQADYTAQQTAIGNAIASGQSINDVGSGGGLSAFGGQGGGMSNQSTAGIQSTAGDMLGGSLREIDPRTGQTTTYSPTQVPKLELMPQVPYDIFNIQNKVNNILEDRDKQGLYTQVTRDAMGNVTGAFNNAPMFGLGFMPNVTTYTGLDQNPYNEDRSNMGGGETETIKPATTNPVSGQPVCPDGYRFDDDLQACRLDTSRPSMPSNPNPFPSGDAYYRATSLDQAPMNVPSGFDFNNANQNFVNQFAYRPANFTNQMGLSGFTPFRRS
jgi:hypothetical protein